MKVLVVGANSQIGKHLVLMIQTSEKLKALAMIRNEEQAAFFTELGAETLFSPINLQKQLKEVQYNWGC